MIGSCTCVKKCDPQTSIMDLVDECEHIINLYFESPDFYKNVNTVDEY